jgi:hypothetical protein
MSYDPAYIFALADAWGWQGLREHQHSFTAKEGSRTPALRITWYDTNPPDARSGCFLQINILPSLCAAVYAVRYRLFTGWHYVAYGDDAVRRDEVARLDSRLHNRWFTSPERRRDLRRAHPECAGFSWKKLRASSAGDFVREIHGRPDPDNPGNRA